MAKRHFFIICGESSGDLAGAGLVEAMKRIDPEVKISAVGGPALKAAGAQVYYDIKKLAVFGFFDALKKLPEFLLLKNLVLAKIKEEKPQAVIFVDFSGFNLRLAKSIRNRIPTVYYISPQVWASRRGRINTIKKYIRRMLVIFKFEVEFYNKYGVKAEFVGHPLLDMVRPTLEKKEFIAGLGLAESKTTIALLPGSRKQEIECVLPVMLKAAQLISREINAQFVIAKAAQLEWDLYQEKIRQSGLQVKIVEGRTYDCLNIADFCLVCSGTATLETAIMQRPFVIVYKMSLLNYLLYRPQVKVPYIGMVNIVAGKSIIPEFIQFRACPARIASLTIKTLKDPLALDKMKAELAAVRLLLGEKGASQRAASLILGDGSPSYNPLSTNRL
jgi:lipid-A-disaccharide synthase